MIIVIVIVTLIIVCLLSRPSNAKPRRRPGRAARHRWGHTIAPSGLLSHFAKDGSVAELTLMQAVAGVERLGGQQEKYLVWC